MTIAMLKRGFDILPPYDVQRGGTMDFFAEAGKESWAELDQQDHDYEHHVPERKTFSRDRGRPFYGSATKGRGRCGTRPM